MLDKLSNLREAAHALVAVLGVLATSGGVIVSLLASLGVTGLDVQVGQFTAVCGALTVLLSKLIDSANDAYVSGAVAKASPPPDEPPQG
jgi:hypothetical protein